MMAKTKEVLLHMNEMISELTRLRKERDELREALGDTLMHLMSKARRDPAERRIVEQIQDVLATHKPASDEIGE